MNKPTKTLKSLKEDAANKKLNLDALLNEWSALHTTETKNAMYNEGAKSFKSFLQQKLK